MLASAEALTYKGMYFVLERFQAAYWSMINRQIELDTFGYSTKTAATVVLRCCVDLSPATQWKNDD